MADLLGSPPRKRKASKEITKDDVASFESPDEDYGSSHVKKGFKKAERDVLIQRQTVTLKKDFSSSSMHIDHTTDAKSKSRTYNETSHSSSLHSQKSSTWTTAQQYNNHVLVNSTNNTAPASTVPSIAAAILKPQSTASYSYPNINSINNPFTLASPTKSKAKHPLHSDPSSKQASEKPNFESFRTTASTSTPPQHHQKAFEFTPIIQFTSSRSDTTSAKASPTKNNLKISSSSMPPTPHIDGSSTPTPEHTTATSSSSSAILDTLFSPGLRNAGSFIASKFHSLTTSLGVSKSTTTSVGSVSGRSTPRKDSNASTASFALSNGLSSSAFPILSSNRLDSNNVALHASKPIPASHLTSSPAATDQSNTSSPSDHDQPVYQLPPTAAASRSKKKDENLKQQHMTSQQSNIVTSYVYSAPHSESPTPLNNSVFQTEDEQPSSIDPEEINSKLLQAQRQLDVQSTSNHLQQKEEQVSSPKSLITSKRKPSASVPSTPSKVAISINSSINSNSTSIVTAATGTAGRRSHKHKIVPTPTSRKPDLMTTTTSHRSHNLANNEEYQEEAITNTSINTAQLEVDMDHEIANKEYDSSMSSDVNSDSSFEETIPEIVVKTSDRDIEVIESEQAGEDAENGEVSEEEFDSYVFMATVPPLETLVEDYKNVRALPLRRGSSGTKVTLVLDLDETLVHCSLEKVDNPDLIFTVPFDGKEYQVYVRKRPGFEQFLTRVSELFEVAVFTASQEAYADKLLSILDPQRKWIHHRLFRDSCVCVQGNYLKDLNVLGRELSKVIIIDNSPHVFAFQIDNGVPIESWFNDSRDRELLHLIPFLETLAKCKDVRPKIRAKFGLHKKVELAAQQIRKQQQQHYSSPFGSNHYITSNTTETSTNSINEDEDTEEESVSRRSRKRVLKTSQSIHITTNHVDHSKNDEDSNNEPPRTPPNEESGDASPALPPSTGSRRKSRVRSRVSSPARR